MYPLKIFNLQRTYLYIYNGMLVNSKGRRNGIEYLNPETINGLNLYAYCGNNPVMRIDPNGNKWWHWVIGVFVLVAVVALAVVTYGASLAVTSAAVAGIEGTLSAATIGLAAISPIAIGAAVTGVVNVLSLYKLA